MANSQISLTELSPWLEQYDAQAFASFQLAISKTDSQLDEFLRDLVDTVNAWKNRYSVGELQGILTTIYQGQILGVDPIPSCTTLYGCENFFSYIRSKPETFFWEVEYLDENDNPVPPDTPVGEGGQPLVVTNRELIEWDTKVAELSTETSSIESLQDSVHHASSNHVYRALFQPNLAQSINTGGASTLEYIFETLGYEKLYLVLNPSLPAPDYKPRED